MKNKLLILIENGNLLQNEWDLTHLEKPSRITLKKTMEFKMREEDIL